MKHDVPICKQRNASLVASRSCHASLLTSLSVWYLAPTNGQWPLVHNNVVKRPLRIGLLKYKIQFPTSPTE